MIFAKEVTTPAQTTREAPQTTDLHITEGSLRHFWVRWRFGSGNLCGVRILHTTFQHWPLTPGEWFPSSTAPLSFPEDLRVEKTTPLLQIQTFNLDDVFDHSVWVAVYVQRERKFGAIEDFFRFLMAQEVTY